MDPLTEMCQALVSINQILNRRQQIVGDNQNYNETATMIDYHDENQTKTLPVIENNRSMDRSASLHLEPLTKENFHRIHLSDRTIDEIPNLVQYEIDRLKSIHIHTIQDLLGRYLIHDVPDDFRQFLIKSLEMSESSAALLMELFDSWTRYNLDSINWL